VRRVTSVHLSNEKDPNVVRALVSAALTDPEQDVREGAVLGLSQMSTPEAVEALRGLFTKLDTGSAIDWEYWGRARSV